MKDFTRKLIEDRLSIKATQRLRRYITPREVSQIFISKNYAIENIEKEFIKQLDKVINEFLEKKQ